MFWLAMDCLRSKMMKVGWSIFKERKKGKKISHISWCKWSDSHRYKSRAPILLYFPGYDLSSSFPLMQHSRLRFVRLLPKLCWLEADSLVKSSIAKYNEKIYCLQANQTPLVHVQRASIHPSRCIMIQWIINTVYIP